ncbi:MAG: hypothetical protein KUG82_18890 [Pseudomonadales bacterium]|nr:hypothetical protein [Pseudomonadales bacterium]
MSQPTKTVPTNKLAELCRTSIDVAALGSDCVQDLGTLFNAISKSKDDPSQVAGLARIGRCLVDDWASMFDCNRSDLIKLKDEIE